MFLQYNKHYLCAVYYHSKFPIIKKADGNFVHYRIPKKLMSDIGGNFGFWAILLKPEHRERSVSIILSYKQWTSESMDQVHQVNTLEMLQV